MSTQTTVTAEAIRVVYFNLYLSAEQDKQDSESRE
jgi:hypothetical protein